MKTKMLVLVGIVVCAILLTPPALASAGYSKIYGNANEDEVLDMRDVTYIKLVIFGKKPATTFADANYDGKISMLDVGQTKLIILGKEKKLTLIDQADRTVTVPRPIERVAALHIDAIRTLVVLGEANKIVGVPSFLAKYASHLACVIAYPKLKELPGVGSSGQENMEFILSLKPDLIFAYPSSADIIQEITGIPVACVSDPAGASTPSAKAYGYGGAFESFRFVGKIMGEESEAEELISYADEKISEVIEVTSQIPDKEKLKVYYSHVAPAGKTIIGPTRPITRYEPIDIAGGINVARDLIPGSGSAIVSVSIEQVIKWNPDVILLISWSNKHPISIEDVLSNPDLQSINAVKNRRVYYIRGGAYGGWDLSTGITDAFYMAKLFYPEKFEDLNVEEEGNEILKRFYGVDGLWTEVAESWDLYRWE